MHASCSWCQFGHLQREARVAWNDALSTLARCSSSFLLLKFYLSGVAIETLSGPLWLPKDIDNVDVIGDGKGGSQLSVEAEGRGLMPPTCWSTMERKTEEDEGVEEEE